MAICETCDYANRPPYKSPCSECDKTMGSPFCCYEHEEKPTNADRIRAMSDDELAEWLFEFDCEAVAIGLLQMEQGLMTKEERLEWLQQSAE